MWDGDERETAVECISRERRKTETESDSRRSARPKSPVISS